MQDDRVELTTSYSSVLRVGTVANQVWMITNGAFNQFHFSPTA